MILGPAAVIGVVVDSFQDILSVSSLDIDYFMLAPFRKSDCKNDESPELGVEGVKSICDKMEGNEINIPRVAEGGITYDDILSAECRNKWNRRQQGDRKLCRHYERDREIHWGPTNGLRPRLKSIQYTGNPSKP